MSMSEKKTTKFKVELMIEVEYNVPEGVCTTPYTSFACAKDINNNIVVFPSVGEIVDGEILKVERQSEDSIDSEE